MAVRFEGFARVVDRSALRPGRWIGAAIGHTAALCFATAIGEGAARVLLTFRPSRVEEIQFAPLGLSEITGALTSIEDDIVFSAGAGSQPVQLLVASHRAIASGALLRLSNGDLGIGYAGDPSWLGRRLLIDAPPPVRSNLAASSVGRSHRSGRSGPPRSGLVSARH
jgi:hypothetical protein